MIIIIAKVSTMYLGRKLSRSSSVLFFAILILILSTILLYLSNLSSNINSFIAPRLSFTALNHVKFSLVCFFPILDNVRLKK